MRILYVEDNPFDANMTRHELQRISPQLELDVVDTLFAARQRLATKPQPYSAVLLDLRLPDGDGLSLLNYIRRSELPVAVVILTGGGDEDSVISALKAGADDYIIKQTDYLSTLYETILTAVDRFQTDKQVHNHRLRVVYSERNAQDIDLTRRHLTRHAAFIQLDVLVSEAELITTLQSETAATPYDVLLLDYNQGPLDALELIKRISRHGKPLIPVVLVTGQGNEEVALQALKLGASDYVVKNPGYLYRLPSILENAFHKAELQHERKMMQEREQHIRLLADHVNDVIFNYSVANHCFKYLSPAIFMMTGYTSEEIYADPDLWQNIIHPEDRNLLEESLTFDGRDRFEKSVRWIHHDGQVVWTEQRITILKSSTGRLIEIHGIARDVTARHQLEAERDKIAIEKDEAIRMLSQSYEKTIESWTLALELRDRDAHGHSIRVANLTVLTAVALGISGEALEHIRRGALLHDIGKLGVPEAILQKPGPLTDAEWLILRIHPAYGYQILAPVEFLRPAIDIPYSHRERWDGSGYPQGLKGEQIPFPARIFAVVDVWEALNSDRPYRPAWDPKQVARFLREQAGIKFDPHVVEVFLGEVVAEK